MEGLEMLGCLDCGPSSKRDGDCWRLLSLCPKGASAARQLSPSRVKARGPERAAARTRSHPQKRRTDATREGIQSHRGHVSYLLDSLSVCGEGYPGSPVLVIERLRPARPISVLLSKVGVGGTVSRGFLGRENSCTLPATKSTTCGIWALDQRLNTLVPQGRLLSGLTAHSLPTQGLGACRGPARHRASMPLWSFPKAEGDPAGGSEYGALPVRLQA